MAVGDATSWVAALDFVAHVVLVGRRTRRLANSLMPAVLPRQVLNHALDVLRVRKDLEASEARISKHVLVSYMFTVEDFFIDLSSSHFLVCRHRWMLPESLETVVVDGVPPVSFRWRADSVVGASARTESSILSAEGRISSFVLVQHDVRPPTALKRRCITSTFSHEAWM